MKIFIRTMYRKNTMKERKRNCEHSDLEKKTTKIITLEECP